mmetsp:Transcript_45705/g.99608  ORF Transcript_45705/g.99608 Transcript_45705/m.99608 type:complete len:226 (+) Transcript_45705:623-1300(+)
MYFRISGSCTSNSQRCKQRRTSLTILRRPFNNSGFWGGSRDDFSNCSCSSFSRFSICICRSTYSSASFASFSSKASRTTSSEACAASLLLLGRKLPEPLLPLGAAAASLRAVSRNVLPPPPKSISVAVPAVPSKLRNSSSTSRRSRKALAAEASAASAADSALSTPERPPDSPVPAPPSRARGAAACGGESRAPPPWLACGIGVTARETSLRSADNRFNRAVRSD